MNETKMRKFAQDNFVPIVRPETSKLLIENVKEINPKSILEVGTAIGYSGILMLENSNANLITLEKDEKMKNLALENFKEENLQNRVKLVFGDTKTYIENSNEKFDFIFLDGPKSQYVKYYPYLLKMLNQNGRIFVDNVLFQGLVLSKEEPPKKFRTIVNNLREFLKLVQTDKKVSFKLIDIEDGVLLIKKNRNIIYK